MDFCIFVVAVRPIVYHGDLLVLMTCFDSPAMLSLLTYGSSCCVGIVMVIF